MESFENVMRGYVLAEIAGGDPERFLNLCAAEGLPFWELKKTSGGALTLRFRLRDWRRACELASGAMCVAREMRRSGFPVLMKRLRVRTLLLGGLLACFLGLCGMSLFIWEIEVTGESAVPRSVVLSALEGQGVGIGTFGQSVDSELVRGRVLLELPQLKWISVNVFGSRAVVSVRDRTEKPDIIDVDEHCDLVAEKSGLIESMEVYAGQAAAGPGSTVLAGETLVSGTLTSLSSGVRTVRSLAQVRARTWYELTAQMPLQALSKAYTGESFTRRAVYFAGRRINLYFNGGISLDEYDKITERHSVTFAGGFTLPISLVTEEYREYETFETELTVGEASEILERGLAARLLERLGEDGTVLEREFRLSRDGGTVTVTLLAECLENIAKEAPLAGVMEETGIDRTDD